MSGKNETMKILTPAERDVIIADSIAAFREDPNYAIAIARQASSVLARRDKEVSSRAGN